MRMTKEGYKCVYCPICPYYEKVTSYGVEKIRCANTDCILHGAEDGDADED